MTNTETTIRYAVVETASINGSFRNAVEKRLVPSTVRVWVQRISTSRARSTYGLRQVKVTGDLDKALTWASREAAEAKAADLSTDYVTYEARAVVRTPEGVKQVVLPYYTVDGVRYTCVDEFEDHAVEDDHSDCQRMLDTMTGDIVLHGIAGF